MIKRLLVLIAFLGLLGIVLIRDRAEVRIKSVPLKMICPKDYDPSWSQRPPAVDLTHFDQIDLYFLGEGIQGHPHYHLVVYGDGRVDIGNGEKTWTLSPGQVHQLVVALNKAHYFSIPDQFTSKYAACYQSGECSPSISATTTSVTVDGKEHTVNDEMCSFAPRELTEFERSIQSIIGVFHFSNLTSPPMFNN